MLQRLCRQPASCWHRTSDRNLLSCSKSSAHRQCARTARHGVRQHLVRAQAVAEASKSAGRKPRGRAASSNAMEPDANEEGMLELPVAADYQQTLRHSFTMGGMGLHTAEYATVRVRPAFAGEGRYFVRVPEGTNRSRFELFGEPEPVSEEEMFTPTPPNPELEEAKVALYMDYLRDQEEAGFDGTFEEWVYALNNWEGAWTREQISGVSAKQVRDVYKKSAAEVLRMEKQGRDQEDPLLKATTGPAEAIEPLDPSDPTLMRAHVSNVKVVGMPYTQLGEDEEEGRVLGAQFLLAALEACGVDNARIEIEGGHEVPILDHSALGWCLEVQQAGLRPAPPPPSMTDAEPTALMQRPAFKPQEPYTVQAGDSWVSAYPSDWIKLSAGVDHQDAAPIIGQPWYSWRFSQDLHFRFELAPARCVAPSVEWLFKQRAEGYIKMGAESMYVIGHRDRWWDPQMVRFPRDEAARHALVSLIGDLALMAEPGGSGLPVGHVVVFQGSHQLHVEFMREFLADLGEGSATTTQAVLDAQDAALARQRAARRAAQSDPKVPLWRVYNSPPGGAAGAEGAAGQQPEAAGEASGEAA